MLRNAAKSWDSSLASKRLNAWLIRKGINKEYLRVYDGSGLSRNNRTTTNSITHILYYMSKHKHSQYYISSMSLLGARGTLKNQYNSPQIDYNFVGKTGTLSGIRSLSGYLNTPFGRRVISIIRYTSAYKPDNIKRILASIYSESSCN